MYGHVPPPAPASSVAGPGSVCGSIASSYYASAASTTAAKKRHLPQVPLTSRSSRASGHYSGQSAVNTPPLSSPQTRPSHRLGGRTSREQQELAATSAAAAELVERTRQWRLSRGFSLEAAQPPTYGRMYSDPDIHIASRPGSSQALYHPHTDVSSSSYYPHASSSSYGAVLASGHYPERRLHRDLLYHHQYSDSELHVRPTFADQSYYASAAGGAYRRGLLARSAAVYSPEQRLYDERGTITPTMRALSRSEG